MSDHDPVPTSKGCQQALRLAGKAYPRTCIECGLGPCKFYRAEKTTTPNNSNSAALVAPTEFDYLLNRFELASQAEKPAELGYGDHRRALFAYVRKLEAAALASQGADPTCPICRDVGSVGEPPIPCPMHTPKASETAAGAAARNAVIYGTGFIKVQHVPFQNVATPPAATQVPRLPEARTPADALRATFRQCGVKRDDSGAYFSETALGLLAIVLAAGDYRRGWDDACALRNPAAPPAGSAPFPAAPGATTSGPLTTERRKAIMESAINGKNDVGDMEYVEWIIEATERAHGIATRKVTPPSAQQDDGGTT